MAGPSPKAVTHEPHPEVGHVVPTRLLAGVLLALLVLTFITVAIAGIPVIGISGVKLGAANIWIALLIATVKGILVALYFMHLRWDKPFNAIILISSLLFVALFIALTLNDTVEYHDVVRPGPAPGVPAARQ